LQLFRGQLQKAEALYRTKSETLEQMRMATTRLSDPVAVCLVEVRRP